MSKPTIYFTVSMWNRLEHFEALLENLKRIHAQDPDIVLYATDFCTTEMANLDRLVRGLPFKCRFWQVQHEFCNGMGHNICIRHILDQEALVAIIAVDLQMPPDITLEIKKHAVPGQSFYGPEVNYMCKNGHVRKCSAAYALIAAAKSDLDRAGELRQNMMWGGDYREGGEDVVLMKQLKARAKLKQCRPFHPGLICRWHPRDVTQRFYSSYRRYGAPAHWDLVNGHGKPLDESGS